MDQMARLDWLARFGYLARAVVYGLLGYLALSTREQVQKGAEGEFELIRNVPGGKAILIVLVIGLLAYGIYKLASAFLDTDSKGHRLRALLERIGIAAGAIAYLAMAFAALRFATGIDAAAEPGGDSRETARALLELPLGNLALILAGIGFLVGALFQLHSAWTKSFMRTIDPEAPPLTCTIGRLGLAARSVVFAVVGWSLLRSAWQEDAAEVKELGGVLHALRDLPTLYFVVAIGLILFAVFSAVEARHRIVPRVNVAEAGKRKLEQKAGVASR